MKEQQRNNIHYDFEAKTLHENCRFPYTDGYLFCPLCGALIEANVNPSSKCKIELMVISLKNRRLNRRTENLFVYLLISPLILNIIFFVSYRHIASMPFSNYYKMQLAILTVLGIESRTLVTLARPLVITLLMDITFILLYSFYIFTTYTFSFSYSLTIRYIALIICFITVCIAAFFTDYNSLPPLPGLRFGVKHPWACFITRCLLMMSYLFYKTSTWFGTQKFSKLDFQIIYDILDTPRNRNVDSALLYNNFFAVKDYFYNSLYFAFFLIICLNVYFLYFTLRVRRLNAIYESEFLQPGEDDF